MQQSLGCPVCMGRNGGADYPAIRTIEGKLCGVGIIQKIIIQCHTKPLKQELLYLKVYSKKKTGNVRIT